MGVLSTVTLRADDVGDILAATVPGQDPAEDGDEVLVVVVNHGELNIVGTEDQLSAFAAGIVAALDQREVDGD